MFGFIAVVVVIVVVVVAFLVLRGRRSPERAVDLHPVVPLHQPPREIGKTLRPGPDACAAAQALAERWYQEGTGPRLPLKECAHAPTCHCQWARTPDRRTEHRRSGHDRRGSVRFDEKPDRRSGFDRRKDMNDSWKGN